MFAKIVPEPSTAGIFTFANPEAFGAFTRRLMLMVCFDLKVVSGSVVTIVL